MKVTAVFMIVLVVIVSECMAKPQHRHAYEYAREKQQTPPQEQHLQRERRSPQGHGKISVLEDSKKGPVAKVEGSGTVWESKDKNVQAKVGVDYTQPLGHGKGEGSAFFRVEGKF